MLDNNFQVHAPPSFLISPSGLALWNNETHDKSLKKCTNHAFPNIQRTGILLSICVLFSRSRSLFSLGRERGLLMYINIAVISAMTYDLNVVVHIMVIVQQVSVFVCSARKKKEKENLTIF